MSLETTLKAIKDYGITGVLVVWLFITNNRLSVVENKLFDCYMMRHSSIKTTQPLYMTPQLIAIIPSNPVGKIEHYM
jgi:hypothetical protein